MRAISSGAQKRLGRKVKYVSITESPAALWRAGPFLLGRGKAFRRINSPPVGKTDRRNYPGGIFMEYLKAFLCGGILCAIGQIFIDKTQLTPARILTGYVVVGVLLSALGLYQPLVDCGRRRRHRAPDRLWPLPCKKACRKPSESRAGWASLPAVCPPLPAALRRRWYSALSWP